MTTIAVPTVHVAGCRHITVTKDKAGSIEVDFDAGVLTVFATGEDIKLEIVRWTARSPPFPACYRLESAGPTAMKNKQLFDAITEYIIVKKPMSSAVEFQVKPTRTRIRLNRGKHKNGQVLQSRNRGSLRHYRW